eukprot:TRINITY_DN1247_c0_g3_i1.p1 TRINITY_DN1247_c0_g3~~TRINITY_DN1247_c0_g3_i1.p1  ORF type:complete len:709 (+),score=74.15 TRINITY_DN1247_c0_g3_i1:129-2255(+)
MNEVNRLGPNKIEFKATSDKLIKLLEFIKALSQTKESTLTIETQEESERRFLKAFWDTIETQADQFPEQAVAQEIEEEDNGSESKSHLSDIFDDQMESSRIIGTISMTGNTTIKLFVGDIVEKDYRFACYLKARMQANSLEILNIMNKYDAELEIESDYPFTMKVSCRSEEYFERIKNEILQLKADFWYKEFEQRGANYTSIENNVKFQQFCAQRQSLEILPVFKQDGKIDPQKFILASRNRKDFEDGIKFFSARTLEVIHLKFIFKRSRILNSEMTRIEMNYKVQYIEKFLLQKLQAEAQGYTVSLAQKGRVVDSSIEIEVENDTGQSQDIRLRIQREHLNQLVVFFASTRNYRLAQDVLNRNKQRVASNYGILFDSFEISPKNGYTDYYWVFVGTANNLVQLLKEKEERVVKIISELKTISFRPFTSVRDRHFKLREYLNSQKCNFTFSVTGMTLFFKECTRPTIDILMGMLLVHDGKEPRSSNFEFIVKSGRPQAIEESKIENLSEIEDQISSTIRPVQASGFLNDSDVAGLNIRSFIQHDRINPRRENESPNILRQLSQEKVDILLNFFKRNTTLKAEQFQISVQKIKSQVLKDRFKANKSRFPEPKKAFFASTHPSEIFYNAVGERNGFRKFPRVSSFTLSSKSTFFFENNQDYVDPEGYHHLFLVNYYPNPKWETNSRSDWTKVSEDDMILPCFLYRFKVQR